jgi:hypothetical protein
MGAGSERLPVGPARARGSRESRTDRRIVTEETGYVKIEEKMRNAGDELVDEPSLRKPFWPNSGDIKPLFILFQY